MTKSAYLPCFLAAVWMASLALVRPESANASEFWDEVRSPGLRVFRTHIRQARRSIRTRAFDEALRATDRAIAALPRRAEAHLLRALALGGLGRRAEAPAVLSHAYSLSAKVFEHPVLGTSSAELAASAGAYDLTARILVQVLGRMQDSKGRQALYVLLGDVQLSLGPDRLSDAVRAYRDALRRSTPNPRALLGLALALSRAGDHEEALEIARRVAAGGDFDHILNQLPVPPTEQAARRAIALEAIRDRSAAERAWMDADKDGPWGAHTQRQRARFRRGAHRVRRPLGGTP